MTYDVIVVGAGPGGCLAARDLARSGLKVGLLDAQERERLGKPIIVEAERTVFDRVGLRPPEGDEVPYHQSRFRFFSRNLKECFTLDGESPAISLRLDEFSRRLCGEAEDAGAVFHGGAAALGPVMESGRVAGARFRMEGGEREVRARLVIDATGFAAALARKVGPEAGIEFEDRQQDVVIAANYFHEIVPDKAREAVAAGRQGDNEVWNRLSRHGNYSTEYSYLSLARGRAYILIGRKASYDLPAVDDLIDRHREEAGYYGAGLYGGGGPIRVRRSLDQLVCDGLMVIGEAACTVIPLHGSGVAGALLTGSLAARHGARALADGRQPTTADLWPYSHEYQSGRGALLATFAAQKLFTDQLTSDQLTAMMEDKVLHPDDIYHGLVPDWLTVAPGTIPARARGVLKNLGLVPAIIRMGMRLGAVKKHYLNYPAVHDPARVAAWKQEARRLFADLEPGP